MRLDLGMTSHIVNDRRVFCSIPNAHESSSAAVGHIVEGQLHTGKIR